MRFSQRSAWSNEANPLTENYLHLKAQGVEIFNLTESNPTRCAFQYLQGLLLEELLHSQNLVYDPHPRGLMEARKAVAQNYASQGITLQPEQIFLVANTSEAYTFLFRLLLEPGELLLAPQPSYPLLDFLAPMNDVKLRRYPLVWKKEAWEISPHLTAMTGPAVRALLTVNPNNPTGNYVKEAERKMLNEFAQAQTLAIIADEVFLDFDFPPPPSPPPFGERVSFASNHEVLTFTLGGISKSLGLPQMKLAWIIVTGPEKQALEAARRLEIISDTYLSASTPSQNALPVWLGLKKAIQDEIRQRLEKNLKSLEQALRNRKDVKLYPPEGGWNTVVEFPPSRTDEGWALLFLEKAHVLTHPGYLFDFEEGSFIVLSLLPPTNIFKNGIKRILSPSL
ncbi:MAG: pyridoxal phosphate-dependent aminotransferase [Candidatus Omnitrophica bacterium]|nr:pyridoxal phosphate-dependent aminotransferase [Candidatus Omnitrophota bacterium]